MLVISLVIAISGILALFFISDAREEQVDISKLDIGAQQDVYITGEITRVSEADKVFFLEISQDNASISVLVFKEGNMSFSEGQNVKVNGELEEYKGSLEIIANYITTT